MRIKAFGKFIELRDELEPLELNNCTVVIDGLNFFYNSYRDSKLPHQLGCESHRYASYLREQLAIFKKSNIKCFFIFKGGHQNLEKMLERITDSRSIGPIFMKSIYKDVLDEMGFQYVTCEYESKRNIIALAQTLDCPVISYDIEFCFSGLQYIPLNELKFNETDNSINSRYFLLDKFLRKYKLTAEKIALFIVLTDQNIYPGDFFLHFFRRIGALNKGTYFERYQFLLHWLSKNNRETTLKMLKQFTNTEDRDKFVKEVEKAQLMIGRRETGGLGAACLLNPAAATVTPGDPNWFSKGVAANHVAISYINLYRSRYFFGGVAVDLVDSIVKYAYDLLTNFQNDGFTYVFDTDSGRETAVVSEIHSIRKPEYEASVCVFENGWGGVRELGLFQHFLKETLQLAQLEPLDQLPEDARLLAVALAYFSRKKRVDTSAEAACVLLSYVTLSLVLEKCDKRNLPKFPFPSKPILDSTTDRSTVTDDDCNIAAAIMADYLTDSDDAADQAIDQEILYPFQEFQNCLRQLNDLNVLCGAPLPPTPYHRAYSGSLVYRLRRAAGPGDSQPFFDKLLGPAPTVYAFLNGLIEVYEAL